MAAGYAAVDWLCFMFVVEGLTLNCLNCEHAHYFSRKEECILKVNCKITRRIWLNMVKIFRRKKMRGHSDTDEQTTVNCCTLSGSQTFDSNERCHVLKCLTCFSQHLVSALIVLHTHASLPQTEKQGKILYVMILFSKTEMFKGSVQLHR